MLSSNPQAPLRVPNRRQSSSPRSSHHGASPSPEEGNGAKEYQHKGFRIGDLVTQPTKISRRRKKEDFIPRYPYWVIVDFDNDKIAVTRYSSIFEDISDAENSNSIYWCWQESYRLRPTGLNIDSYRKQKERAANNLRAAHDEALDDSAGIDANGNTLAFSLT